MALHTAWMGLEQSEGTRNRRGKMAFCGFDFIGRAREWGLGLGLGLGLGMHLT